MEAFNLKRVEQVATKSPAVATLLSLWRQGGSYMVVKALEILDDNNYYVNSRIERVLSLLAEEAKQDFPQ